MLGLTPSAEAVAGNAAIGVTLSTMRSTADFTVLESWSARAAPGSAGTGTQWPDGDLAYTIAVTAKHISAIVDENLRDTFDSRIYDARLYGGSAAQQRKAQSVWIMETLRGRTAAVPEFDPARLIPSPATER
ncbi:MAG: hypothetical protein OXC28_04990 [Defluviicoccus sp.]|nr:hypothetical protein [Defluviicoccus sp.]